MFAPTAPYIIHLLKVHSHSVSLCNKTCGLFLHHFAQELWQFLQFACMFYHVEIEFVFAVTVPYIILLLKVHCHSVFLGKLHK